MLMPGLRIKLWPIFAVQKFPWVQVPGGRDRRGDRAGRCAAADRREERRVPDRVRQLLRTSRRSSSVGGQKGVQRPVLPPGTLMPIHPVAFLVLTPQAGVRPAGVAGPRRGDARRAAGCSRPESFGLTSEALRVVVIAPEGPVDMIGIVTVLEGEPLPSGDIASRLGGYADVAAMEEDAVTRGASASETDARIIEVLLGNKNNEHNNYQDFQRVPRQRRQDRPAARPAPLRRVPAEPVPRAGRDGADARGEPGRGRGHQGVRRPADARHVGQRVQVRLDRVARPPRHLAGAAAHRQVPDQPALLRGRDRADVDPHAQLVEGDERVAQPRRAARADRGQEP